MVGGAPFIYRRPFWASLNITLVLTIQHSSSLILSSSAQIFYSFDHLFRGHLLEVFWSPKQVMISTVGNIEMYSFQWYQVCMNLSSDESYGSWKQGCSSSFFLLFRRRFQPNRRFYQRIETHQSQLSLSSLLKFLTCGSP